MAPELKAYAEGLTEELVGKVILFTTSNWSRRTVLESAIERELARAKEEGIFPAVL